MAISNNLKIFFLKSKKKKHPKLNIKQSETKSGLMQGLAVNIAECFSFSSVKDFIN